MQSSSAIGLSKIGNLQNVIQITNIDIYKNNIKQHQTTNVHSVNSVILFLKFPKGAFFKLSNWCNILGENPLDATTVAAPARGQRWLGSIRVSYLVMFFLNLVVEICVSKNLPIGGTAFAALRSLRLFCCSFFRYRWLRTKEQQNKRR